MQWAVCSKVGDARMIDYLPLLEIEKVVSSKKGDSDSVLLVATASLRVSAKQNGVFLLSDWLQ